MKTVTIEELLTWAFVHELPKGGGVDGLDNANSAWRMLEASSWGKITSFAELGALIDTGGNGNNYFIEQGEPHEDAVTIGRAVAGLQRCDVAIPANWPALADWPDTDGMAEDAVKRAVDRYMVRTAPRASSALSSAPRSSAASRTTKPSRARPAWSSAAASRRGSSCAR
jgi:hypothetical protein